jgi:hypothetical protein
VSFCQPVEFFKDGIYVEIEKIQFKPRIFIMLEVLYNFCVSFFIKHESDPIHNIYNSSLYNNQNVFQFCTKQSLFSKHASSI